MTKAEYHELKAKIVTEYGEAEWDMGQPVNESARRLNELATTYRVGAITEAAKKRKELRELADSAEQVKSEKSYKSLGACLDKQDLAPFTTKECGVLESFFENPNQTDKELGHKHGVTYQFVVALKKSLAFKMLYNKVLDRLLPIEAGFALRKAINSGDSQIIRRVAEHYGLLKAEQTDLTIKPKEINDPEVMKMLRELGDNWAENKNKMNNGENNG